MFSLLNPVEGMAGRVSSALEAAVGAGPAGGHRVGPFFALSPVAQGDRSRVRYSQCEFSNQDAGQARTLFFRSGGAG